VINRRAIIEAAQWHEITYQGFFQGEAGGAFAPPQLWLALPWEFCSDSESIQVF